MAMTAAVVFPTIADDEAAVNLTEPSTTTTTTTMETTTTTTTVLPTTEEPEPATTSAAGGTRSSGDSGGLGAGAIAGILIGVLVLVAVVIVMVILYLKRRSRTAKKNRSNPPSIDQLSTLKRDPTTVVKDKDVEAPADRNTINDRYTPTSVSTKTPNKAVESTTSAVYEDYENKTVTSKPVTSSPLVPASKKVKTGDETTKIQGGMAPIYDSPGPPKAVKPPRNQGNNALEENAEDDDVYTDTALDEGEDEPDYDVPSAEMRAVKKHREEDDGEMDDDYTDMSGTPRRKDEDKPANSDDAEYLTHDEPQETYYNQESFNPPQDDAVYQNEEFDSPQVSAVKPKKKATAKNNSKKDKELDEHDAIYVNKAFEAQATPPPIKANKPSRLKKSVKEEDSSDIYYSDPKTPQNKFDTVEDDELYLNDAGEEARRNSYGKASYKRKSQEQHGNYGNDMYIEALPDEVGEDGELYINSVNT